LRILFYLGHPAHFHLFRRVIETLHVRGHAIQIVIKKKDVLEGLLNGVGWPYVNVLATERGHSRAAIAWALLKRDLRLLPIAKRFQPHLMIGTSAEIAHAGRLLGIASVVVNEDDYDVVPLFARLAYPFASRLVAPAVCRMGRWAHKTTTYSGYHELAYLHPAHYKPDTAIKTVLGVGDEPYFLLRFAKLTAHHDAGARGIDLPLARRLIEILRRRGRVFISAERELEPELESYRIQVDPLRMHDALFFAHMYIGDSQTMAAEAAVLGTPSVRFNDFVGRISYLEELEHRFGLTEGISASLPGILCERVSDLAGRSDLKAEWAEKRSVMLRDKIDVAQFFVSFIESYGEPTCAQ
jgi:predicted glycosyltransferase